MQVFETANVHLKTLAKILGFWGVLLKERSLKELIEGSRSADYTVLVVCNDTTPEEARMIALPVSNFLSEAEDIQRSYNPMTFSYGELLAKHFGGDRLYAYTLSVESMVEAVASMERHKIYVIKT